MAPGDKYCGSLPGHPRTRQGVGQGRWQAVQAAAGVIASAQFIAHTSTAASRAGECSPPDWQARQTAGVLNALQCSPPDRGSFVWPKVLRFQESVAASSYGWCATAPRLTQLRKASAALLQLRSIGACTCSRTDAPHAGGAGCADAVLLRTHKTRFWVVV